METLNAIDVPGSEINLVQNSNSDSSNSDQVDVSKLKTQISLVDERLAIRRKSFVPMSSMEEENLRERLHLAQLKQCSNIVSQDTRYNRDTFKRLFQSKKYNFGNRLLNLDHENYPLLEQNNILIFKGELSLLN
ncbi:hypothetical protein FQA39_LY08031 [Lamprigera yunnana]|nr:hypothetical protein FQA39_LY08031 [Lamprigera yunnana]